MAGLVLAISIREAQCPPKRGRRDKPGDDAVPYLITSQKIPTTVRNPRVNTTVRI